ncbi:MAG: GNAT family N-acetyltransferase [Pseudomonadota bacterium]
MRYHECVNVLQEMFADGAVTSAVATPFDRPEWYALLSQECEAPLIARAHDRGEQAALVLAQSKGRLNSYRNWYSFIWRPLVTEAPRESALLTALAHDLRSHGHRVTLAPVPNEDGSASRLARAFTDAGWRVETTRCDTNHFLAVNGRSFEDYWSARPGHLRTTHKRKASKVAVSILDTFDDDAWAEYEAIYAASWKPTEDHPAMLRAFAEAEGRAGRLRLGLASHKGQSVAAQFWTVENSVAYIHKLAHLESHKHLSAGTTLSAALFERVIDTDKVDMIDFGTGDEPYKRDWMESWRPRYRIDCLDMRSPRAWLDLVRLALRRTSEPNPPALARLPLGG